MDYRTVNTLKFLLEQGYTQKQISSFLGISQSTVSNYKAIFKPLYNQYPNGSSLPFVEVPKSK